MVEISHRGTGLVTSCDTNMQSRIVIYLCMALKHTGWNSESGKLKNYLVGKKLLFFLRLHCQKIMLYTAIKENWSFKEYTLTCRECSSLLKVFLIRLEMFQDVHTTNNLCWKLPFEQSLYLQRWCNLLYADIFHCNGTQRKRRTDVKVPNLF